MHVHAGTSGFSYKEWKGEFYPDKIAAKEMLAFYSTKLSTVEINNTFYRLPKREVVETWAAQVPDHFRFSIKASRRITHMKRLKDPTEETAYLLETVEALGDKLGCILYQLPPNMKKDIERLQTFIAALDPAKRSVFEFRHDSWFDDETYEALRHGNCALCLADTDDHDDPADIIRTADFGYLRLRRPDYSKPQLQHWAKEIANHNWTDAFVFFKHEDEAAGPRMAMQFLELTD